MKEWGRVHLGDVHMSPNTSFCTYILHLYHSESPTSPTSHTHMHHTTHITPLHPFSLQTKTIALLTQPSTSTTSLYLHFHTPPSPPSLLGAAYSPSSLLYAAYPSGPAFTSPAPPTAPPTRDQRGIVERYVSYSIPSRLYCPGYEDGSPGDSRTRKSCCVSSCLCCECCSLCHVTLAGMSCDLVLLTSLWLYEVLY